MARQDRDPVAARDDGSRDLYEVADWEVRSVLDRVAYLGYHGLLALLRVAVVLLAVVILAGQFVLGGLGAITDPVLGAFTVLSVVPALALAVYVWRADVTTSEPLGLLVVTFLLGVLFATFAGVLNAGVGTPLRRLFSAVGFVPAVGSVAAFYVVVGPVEETVKLLAVRLFAYRSDRFDAVIDGAVYGAVAGLGFATIENALYISQAATAAGVKAGVDAGQAGGVALFRSLAGPGHVIYSGFAGYYLGLAKFNREHAGPIVLKGLLIAAVVHATYNSLVGVVPSIIGVLGGVDQLTAFFAFVVVYDGCFGYLLVRKVGRYAEAYEAVTQEDPDEGVESVARERTRSGEGGVARESVRPGDEGVARESIETDDDTILGGADEFAGGDSDEGTDDSDGADQSGWTEFDS